jgi:hypothetical protein
VSSSTHEGAAVYVKKQIEERFVGEQETTVITGNVQVITKNTQVAERKTIEERKR